MMDCKPKQKGGYIKSGYGIFGDTGGYPHISLTKDELKSMFRLYK